jgi:hypothetical protein
MLYADCGKIGISPRPPQTSAPPTQPIPDVPDEVDIPPVPPDGEDGTVGLPGNSNDSDSIDGSLSLFKETRQHALVAWNGKEQMLFLTTNEQSLVGTRAMISITPLPGAPISIKESDKKIITRANNLVQDKILKTPKNIGLGDSLGLVFKTEIGPHKIFVWKIDDLDTLKNDLNHFIAKTYGKNFSALISTDGMKIIRSYHDKGFKYFAFDLIKVDSKSEKTKKTILYHYKSNFAFYPVAISQVGGSGVSTIILTIISPKGFNKIGLSLGGMNADTLGKARQGGVEVDLSLDDLKSIDPALEKFFRNNNGAKARIFKFTGNLDGSNKNGLQGLNKDVILWSE